MEAMAQDQLPMSGFVSEEPPPPKPVQSDKEVIPKPGGAPTAKEAVKEAKASTAQGVAKPTKPAGMGEIEWGKVAIAIGTRALELGAIAKMVPHDAPSAALAAVRLMASAVGTTGEMAGAAPGMGESTALEVVGTGVSIAAAFGEAALVGGAAIGAGGLMSAAAVGLGTYTLTTIAIEKGPLSGLGELYKVFDAPRSATWSERDRWRAANFDIVGGSHIGY